MTLRLVRRLDDREMVPREYSTTERLTARRIDRTGWLHGEDEPWRLALRFLDAFAEMLGPLSAPAGPYPFRATRRNCVLVADV